MTIIENGNGTELLYKDNSYIICKLYGVTPFISIEIAPYYYKIIDCIDENVINTKEFKEAIKLEEEWKNSEEYKEIKIKKEKEKKQKWKEYKNKLLNKKRYRY